MNFYDHIINIETWQHDELYNGIYNEGAREKDLYHSPVEPGIDVIKPNWQYMFKLSRSLDWCPWQFWVEIIAYRLGCLIGVKVPPAHIGYNAEYQYGSDKVATFGSLIEWIYDDSKDAFIHGSQFMLHKVDNYDRDKGSKHNFNSIATGVLGNFPKFVEYWAGVFVLDTLIANTDRHHDNWGIVILNGKSDPKNASVSFAPAFDNGTAMEYGELEENFDKFKNSNKLKKHLFNPKYAAHQMKWSLYDEKPLNYFEFMGKFVLKYPESKSTISGHLSFSREQVEEKLYPLCELVDDKFRLTPTRLKFMLDMMFRRKAILEEVLQL